MKNTKTATSLNFAQMIKRRMNVLCMRTQLSSHSVVSLVINKTVSKISKTQNKGVC